MHRIWVLGTYESIIKVHDRFPQCREVNSKALIKRVYEKTGMDMKVVNAKCYFTRELKGDMASWEKEHFASMLNTEKNTSK